jgi:hypothetical protein
MVDLRRRHLSTLNLRGGPHGHSTYLSLLLVGMGVHLAVIHVCVILQGSGGEPEVHRRQFGAFQRDRRAMAEWIAGFAPDTVVMEATFIYWKSPYAALEKAGIRARVVNAQHVKNVPGRKTDINDAEWLAMLARAGRLARQFYPAGETTQLAPNKPLPPPHHGHVGGREKPLGAPSERCRHPPHGGGLRPPRGGSPRPDRLPARWWHARTGTPVCRTPEGPTG